MHVFNANNIREKIGFPLIRELLGVLINKYYATGFCREVSQSEVTEFIFNGIENVKHSIFNYGERKIIDVIKEPKCELARSKDDLGAMIEKLKNRWRSPNEFFTIFDILAGTELYVDDHIKDVLGIEPEEFKSAELNLNDPSQSIYFVEDVYHVLRFGMISYFALLFPGFKWTSQSDHTLFRFRLNTSRSKLEAIRKLPYLAVEKRSFLIYDNVSREIGFPQYHFDLLSVYPHLQISTVTNTFVTKDAQGVFINSFTYALNVYLIDIPPKYILLLDERASAMIGISQLPIPYPLLLNRKRAGRL